MKIIRKSVSVLLSLIMIVSLFTIIPLTVNADSISPDDLLNDNSIYKYAVNVGSATITGLKESVTETDLDIPSEIGGYPVTGIGNSAFQSTDITSVTIPDSVTSIEKYAFEYCRSLKNVIIGNGVRSIGDRAFSSIAITSVNIPDSVTSIGNNAFYFCDSLESVTIGNGVKSIGDEAFYFTAINSIIIPDSVTSIGNSAFKYCMNLQSVVFVRPSTQQNLQIGENAFENVPGALNYSDCNFYSLFDGDTKVEEGVQLSTLSGKTLTWKRLSSVHPESIYTYTVNNGSATITGLKTSVTEKELDIPSEIGGYPVTSIGNRAFRVTAITDVNIPDSVTSIEDNAFALCRSLKSVTMGKGIVSIGDSAFRRTAITSVTIPYSVTSIGISAFDRCESLTNVIFECPSTPQTLIIGVGAFEKVPGTISFSGYKFIPLYNGDTKVAEGTALADLSGKTLAWKEIFTYTVENDTVTITGLNVSVKELIIPSEINGYPVTSIGESAFQRTDITSVTIPDSVKNIDNNAFKSCDSLKSVSIGNGVTSIGELAFCYCDRLDSVIIGNSVKSICDRAFRGTALTSITIPGSVTSIGDDVFQLCESLTSVIFERPNERQRLEIESSFAEISGTLSYSGTSKYALFSRDTEIEKGADLTTLSGVSLIWKEIDYTPTYTVTWKSDDGSTIDSIEVEAGTVPTHADPAKAVGAQYTYTFSGWTDGKNYYAAGEALPAVTCDVTYTAQYSTTVNNYTVTWKSGDTVLKTDENVPYGTTPTYDGDTPTKAADAQYSYTFIGWTDGNNSYAAGEAFPAVTGNITYNAVFTETVNNYTVIWKNGDTIIETDTDVPYGTSPTYDGDEPTKAADENYGYVFDGWSPEVNIVTGNVTYTAQFNQALHVDKAEPYIDSNGAYILGTKEHYEMDGKNYAVNQDRSVGDEMSDIEISYFEFSELDDGTYQLLHYTGPKDSEYIINELVIPDTYNGKKITVLGTGNSSDSVVKASPVMINKLVLGKNLTEVKKHAFVQDVLVKVTGNTANLKTIGELAFGEPFGASDMQLDISLDYPGTINNSGSVFGGYEVTLHLKHATTFASSLQGDTVTYDFTDDHTYGEPVWSWLNGYISATAKFTCSDSRCKQETTVHAPVKKTEAVDKTTYTAEATFESKSYSDIKEVPKPCYNITVGDVDHGTVIADKTQAYAGEEITLTGNPDEGYSIISFSVRDAADNAIEVTNNKFIMPDSDVTVSATSVYGIYHAVTEPSIDENGAYKLGNVEYLAIDGKNYAVNADKTPGEELDSVELSYFTFASAGGNYRIDYYTGHTENLTELRFPKTYGGKKITEIGNGNYEPLFHTASTEPISVYLTENIIRIRPNAFEQLRIEKVSGDTSALSNIGGFAFSCLNGTSDFPKLEIQLDYPGRITTNEHSFRDLDVVIRLKHATTLSKTDFVASSVEYIFTDGHVGTPIWTWADDYSTATAEFTCTDSRCKHEETVNATVTQSDDGGKITYTATATIGETEYTDTKVVIYNPLDELFEPSITATDALGLDKNLFALPGELVYTKAKLLGVQKKEAIKTDTAGTGLRFVAELSSEFVGKDNIDYGFEVVKTSKNSTAEFAGANGFGIMQELLESHSDNIKSISCKDTSNNITGDTRYGDKDDTSTEYKYVTLAVNNIEADQGIAVRFYVAIDGIRYYSSYTNSGGDTFRGCCASYETLVNAVK